MRPTDIQLVKDLTKKLQDFDQNIISLPGLNSKAIVNALVLQMVDSMRRIKYIDTIRSRRTSKIYADPHSPFFDPFKAAAWCQQNGFIDDAFWMIFIGTHFGKNRRTGWSLAGEVFKGGSNFGNLTWKTINANFNLFRQWLQANLNSIKSAGSFGNHRKYQSLDAYSATGTGMAIGSYLDWVGPAHDHQALISNAVLAVGNDRKILFDYLYRSMAQVVSFGRTARFDYLTMIGKFRLADIEPGLTYMSGATGPKRGAKLLFDGNASARISEDDLNQYLSQLEQHLGLYFGMQVLEDSLCNWQKNPTQFIHFAG
jgi:hypothetical protein